MELRQATLLKDTADLYKEVAVLKFSPKRRAVRSRPDNKAWLITRGSYDYYDSWKLQKALFDARLRRRVPDTLMLVEHEPVITMGRESKPEEFLVDKEFLFEQGIRVYTVDRGGKLTFHGPGQLVGYPILNLNQDTPDLPLYLRKLEDVLIAVCSEWGVEAYRRKGLTGVWTRQGKLAFIGVKITRGITMHGFSLNNHANLNGFNWIVPCGLSRIKVTSLEDILGYAVPKKELVGAVIHHFSRVFNLNFSEISSDKALDSTAGICHTASLRC